jgi:hypothetical protein
METIEFINLYHFISPYKTDLENVCFKYGIERNRIYWENFIFHLDVFKSEM